jgi:hypothetical protein
VLTDRRANSDIQRSGPFSFLQRWYPTISKTPIHSHPNIAPDVNSG